MITLQVFITKGNQFGWTNWLTIVLAAIAIIFAYLFIKFELKYPFAFVDLHLFNNNIFTGAVLSNFFINGTAGLLIVSLTLMQKGADYTPMQAGLLTLGFALAVILFMRVGEKLLQHFGAKKPIIWGALIIAASLIILMQTQLMAYQYQILAILAYTLFGVGLAFFATPATDAALSNLPENQAGSGAGIFKMASSLGASFGVAISAGIYTALANREEPIEWLSNLVIFVGRQDNVSIRQGAMLALAFCLLLVVLVIITVIIKIPNDTGKQIK